MVKICAEEEETKCDYIIKRNLRREDPLEYFERVKLSRTTKISSPRPGKTVYRDWCRADIGLKEEIVMVTEIIVRETDKY